MPASILWHDFPATSVLWVFVLASYCGGALSVGAWELRKLRQVFKLRGRPLEPSDKYNQRTAHRIYSWSGATSIKMLFHRVLQGVYKSAWEGRLSPCHFGATPLKWAREYRDEALRAALHALPERARLQSGLKHPRGGPTTSSCVGEPMRGS